jgi:hypothetical protein
VKRYQVGVDLSKWNGEATVFTVVAANGNYVSYTDFAILAEAIEQVMKDINHWFDNNTVSGGYTITLVGDVLQAAINKLNEVK